METVTETNTKAMEQLLSVMPMLNELKEYIEYTKASFTPIKYYARFKYLYDTPHILPVAELYYFSQKMEFFKASFLEFKKTFNENELPLKIRKIFMKTFLSIVKEGLPKNRETNDYMIGGCCGVWSKGSVYVLKHWKHFSYQQKVEYSQHAYNHITSYFLLVSRLNDLEHKITSCL